MIAIFMTLIYHQTEVRKVINIVEREHQQERTIMLTLLIALIAGVVPTGHHEDYARSAWIINDAVAPEGGSVCEVTVLIDAVFFEWQEEFSYEDPGDIRRINGPLTAVGMLSREGGWQPEMVVVGFENEMFSMMLHDCAELDRMVQLGVYSADEIGEFILSNLQEY